MIIIRVELHSAITRKITELARMHIVNTGDGNNVRRNYKAMSFRGRCKEDLDRGTIQKEAYIKSWPSMSFHVWNLVAKALKECGYNQGPQ
jgi:hypothetical protein